VRLVRNWTGEGDTDHKTDLWNSILKASGFRPSFSVWWTSTPAVRGVVAVLPGTSPDFALASLVFDGFVAQFKLLETHLRSHQSYAKKVHQGHAVNALFKAVRRDPPAPVELLTRTVQGTIASLDLDDIAVEFPDECQWTDGVPFVHAGRSFKPLVVTPDKLYLDSLEGFSPGDVVVQTQQTGHLSDLFKAFHDQWAVRWQKHDKIPASQWANIMDFARATLRPVQVDAPRLTVSVLREMIRAKSPKTASGLDGVSKWDLMALSDVQLGSLLSMYQRAETDGVWPQACMAGSVRSLAKTLEPQSPSDYRPVTVLSLVYRLWSSFQAKFWLRALSGSLNPLLCGNRPGGQTCHVWRWILQELEHARHLEGPVSGFVADLVKAFNTLPRLPTMLSARLMGVAQETVVAWSGALSSIRRHFAVRQSFSSGLDSSTGFPEGCALSCLGMLVLDELLHKWLDQLSPSICGLTFVDNWEVVVKDVQWLLPAFQRLCTFVDMLDLQLDQAKTYFWSTCASTRAQLRSSGKSVKLSARDLGAHVVYSCQISNQTLAARIDDLASFWLRLRGAGGRFCDRVRVIRCAAWPRALHACAAVVIGRRFVDTLRTECMKALKLNKPGASPWLQFCLEGDGFDPQQWIILDTLRCYRAAGFSEVSSFALGVVVAASAPYVPGSAV